jgi:hypothetical protein
MPSIALSLLRLQFEKLVIKPLSALLSTQSPIALVIDALDECGTAKDRKDLLVVLAAQSCDLPKFVRIIITSRDEFNIRATFVTRSHILIQELDISADHNSQDILTFLCAQLMAIRLVNTSLSLPPDWPGDSALHMLAEHAVGLFICASTACRFINGPDPPNRLDILLRDDIDCRGQSALNSMYQTAIKSAGMWDDDEFCVDFRAIMGTILVAKNPLSDNAIDTLLLLQCPCHHTISWLGCVLRWSDMEPICIIHPSFADFLSDHLQCGSPSWYINTSLHNQLFATQCLKYLDTALRKNICNLHLSLVPVNEVLREATSYACTSWMKHIIDIKKEEESIVEVLEQFLFQHLLHWIEAMSILKESRTIVASLRLLLNWLQVYYPHSCLAVL